MQRNGQPQRQTCPITLSLPAPAPSAGSKRGFCQAMVALPTEPTADCRRGWPGRPTITSPDVAAVPETVVMDGLFPLMAVSLKV